MLVARILCELFTFKSRHRLFGATQYIMLLVSFWVVICFFILYYLHPRYWHTGSYIPCYESGLFSRLLQRGPNKVPIVSLALIAAIALIFIMVGQVNTLGPIVTMPFMLTYAAVDYAYFSLAMTFNMQMKRDARFSSRRSSAFSNNSAVFSQKDRTVLSVDTGVKTYGSTYSKVCSVAFVVQLSNTVSHWRKSMEWTIDRKSNRLLNSKTLWLPQCPVWA